MLTCALPPNRPVLSLMAVRSSASAASAAIARLLLSLTLLSVALPYAELPVLVVAALHAVVPTLAPGPGLPPLISDAEVRSCEVGSIEVGSIEVGSSEVGLMAFVRESFVRSFVRPLALAALAALAALGLKTVIFMSAMLDPASNSLPMLSN